MKYRKLLGIVVAGVLLLGVALVGLAQEKPFQGMKLLVVAQALESTTYLEPKIPEFEAQTGMKVVYQLLPEVEMVDKIVLDCATGAGKYQIFNLFHFLYPEFVKAEWVVPLDEYITPEFKVDDFFEPFLGSIRYGGKIYGIPVYGESGVVWYRHDLYKEYGLTPPETFQELATNAAKLTHPPKLYGIVLRGKRGWGMNMYNWAPFLKSHGGEFFDENWFPIFNSQEGVYALRIYVDLVQKFSPPGTATATWEECSEGVMSGLVAMNLETTDNVGRVLVPERSPMFDRLSASLWPVGPTGRHPEYCTSDLSISVAGAKTEKERKAAWAFIEWATSPEMEEEKALKGKVATSARRSAYMTPEFREIFGKGRFRSWLETSLKMFALIDPEVFPLIPEWRVVGDRIGIAIEEACVGIKSPREALDEAAADVRKVMAKAGRYK